MIVVKRAPKLNNDLVHGLGLGLINRVDLYYESTASILNAIVALGTSHNEYAKEFALSLLQKSDPYYENTDTQLKSAVASLRNAANAPSGDSSEIWSFRSENKVCKTIPGQWGDYYPCPKYTASVSDQKGNRILLTCRSNEFGINFRIRPSRELWSQLANAKIEGLGFGTDKIHQWLGIPYLISEDFSLFAEEALSEELLNHLRSDKVLNITLRLNSGESNRSVRFNLSGSNKAIEKLLSYCR
jgi:hypothetical protein